MLKWLVWFPLRLVRWALIAVGAVALLLMAMIATPLVRPPELKSIAETARAVDRSTMPALERFSARDGTELAYRHYPARGPVIDKVAIVIHGSSGSSIAVHALADALAGRGIETYAPDLRGHGSSGTRGDIAYIGQLEDDLADLVAVVRKTAPTEPITLLGHSSGGGFALRIASSPIKDLFARTVMLAPYLGYDAPTNRPQFRRLGQRRHSALPCACHAAQSSASIAARRCRCSPSPCRQTRKDPGFDLFATGLMRNFATRGYKNDLAATAKPVR